MGNWLKDIMGVPFIPDSLEEAGFLIDLLSDPKTALEKASVAHRVAMQDAASGRRGKRVGVQMSPDPVRSLEPVTEMKSAEDSEEANAQAREVEKSETPAERVTFHLGADDAATPAGQPDTPAVYPSSAAIVASNFSDQPFKRTPEQLEHLQDVAEVEAKYRASKYGQRQEQSVQQTIENRMETAERTMNVSKWSPYTKTQYGQQFPHSTLRHTALCSQRQVKLLSRNLTMVVPRTANAVIMGLVYGTLFWQLSDSDFSSKLGLLENAVMFMAFSNFQELPVAAEAKQVVVRQTDAGFYPSISYSIAVNLLTIPLAMIETVIFVSAHMFCQYVP